MHDSFLGSQSVAAMISHYNLCLPQATAANDCGVSLAQQTFGGYPPTFSEQQAQRNNSMLNSGHSSFADAHQPMHYLMPSSSTNMSSPLQYSTTNGTSHAATPHAHPAASQSPSHTNGLSMGSSSSAVNTDLSAAVSATSTTHIFNNTGGAAGINQNQNVWSTTIQQNKQIIEAWQTLLLAKCSFSDTDSSSPCGGPPPTRLPHLFDNGEYDNQSNSCSSSSRNNLDSNLGTDSGHRSKKQFSKKTHASSSDGTMGSFVGSGGSEGGSGSGSGAEDSGECDDQSNSFSSSSGNDLGDSRHRSRKECSKMTPASSSDGTMGSSCGSGGSTGSGKKVSPDNSDATSSSSQPRHKKERRDKKAKKSEGRKGGAPKPKKSEVELYPRRKKTEDHRARDHMIISLEHLKPLFHLPLKQAATELGICTTALKSVCRKVGLNRWPYKLLLQVRRNEEDLALMLPWDPAKSDAGASHS